MFTAAGGNGHFNVVEIAFASLVESLLHGFVGCSHN
jgi:hypothetical protein